LGKMFDSGTGLSQSYAEAARWYRKSAEQGNAEAQFALGDMYASGQGITSDYLRAYMWLTLSAAGSNNKTMPARLRDSLLKQMTSRQIEEAEQLVRDWKPMGAHTLKADQIGNDMSNGPYYVGDRITDPIPLAKPSPQFTEAARQAGINGTVVVRGVVRKDGKVDSLEVVKGFGLSGRLMKFSMALAYRKNSVRLSLYLLRLFCPGSWRN
jgi:TPR repeat protein